MARPQELLDSPNNSDAAQEPAWKLFNQSQPKYILRVKEEVRRPKLLWQRILRGGSRFLLHVQVKKYTSTGGGGGPVVL